MTIQFVEAGTYVIETTTYQTSYPDFTLGVTNISIGIMLLKIFLIIGVGIGGFVLMIMINTVITNKTFQNGRFLDYSLFFKRIITIFSYYNMIK